MNGVKSNVISRKAVIKRDNKGTWIVCLHPSEQPCLQNKQKASAAWFENIQELKFEATIKQA